MPQSEGQRDMQTGSFRTRRLTNSSIRSRSEATRWREWAETQRHFGGSTTASCTPARRMRSLRVPGVRCGSTRTWSHQHHVRASLTRRCSIQRLMASSWNGSWADPLPRSSTRLVPSAKVPAFQSNGWPGASSVTSRTQGSWRSLNSSPQRCCRSLRPVSAPLKTELVAPRSTSLSTSELIAARRPSSGN